MNVPYVSSAPSIFAARLPSRPLAIKATQFHAPPFRAFGHHSNIDVYVSTVEYRATMYDVRRALAQVFRSEDFYSVSDPQVNQIIFDVELNMDDTLCLRNKGTGTLELPRICSFNLPGMFWRWLKEHPNSVRVNDCAV
ncbi:hypothetical protein AcV7_008741 [Taiwanofungus camphoratus]|nr:hypothetical protein AcV7_008741 [Antrodia cinnamomea]